MTKYLTCAETAKLVRKALKESFPGTKFSVRSKNSIRVSWTDGPTTAQVKKVTDVFEGATFDGMTDYKGTKRHLLDGELVGFGADFIFCERGLSSGYKAEVRKAWRALEVTDRVALMNGVMLGEPERNGDPALALARVLPMVQAQDCPTVRRVEFKAAA